MTTDSSSRAAMQPSCDRRTDPGGRDHRRAVIAKGTHPSDLPARNTQADVLRLRACRRAEHRPSVTSQGQPDKPTKHHRPG
jgi:hypothetical protein